MLRSLTLVGAALVLAGTVACGPKEETAQETAAPTPTLPTETEDPLCEAITVDYDGPDEPHVGDTWTVWLRCDEALVTGPTIIQSDPLDFMHLKDNVVTWVYAGTGTLKVQVGTLIAYETVTVVD
jgi:hypothetical protein